MILQTFASGFEDSSDLGIVVSLDGVASCVAERGCARWLRCCGKGLGELFGDVADVCS